MTGPDVYFAYGSLIWRPPPHTISRQAGYVKGFSRRFAQSSSDHRGTPEAPGRVVTLVPRTDWLTLAPDDPYESNGVVWGCIYEIDPEHTQEVRDYMDHREKDGYSLEKVTVYNLEDKTGQEYVLRENARVYIGHVTNPSFTGYEDIDALALHISKSRGPSGSNPEYLYELERAIVGVSEQARDAYLEALSAKVKVLEMAGA